MADNPAKITNMNKSSIIVAAVVAVAVSLAVGFWIAPQPSVSPDPFGGLERNIRENLREGVNTDAIGSFNGVLTVASGSKTYTATEICNYSTVTLDGDTYASAQAQTLPSASTLIQACLPNKGDYHDVLWLNLSVDENPTIAKGSNIDLWIASSSAGSTLEIPTNQGVLTRFTNIETGSISVQTLEFKHQ